MIMNRTETMQGFNHLDMDEVHSPSSDYSLASQANMLSSAPGMFSLSQTGPADLTGPTWDAAAEGPQNFPFSDHGDVLYTGEPEDYMLAYGHITPKQDRLEGADDMHTSWTTAAAVDASHVKAEPMRRGTSKSSAGSHGRHGRTAKASSKKTQSRVQNMLSLTSSQLSSIDMTGNVSAFREGSMAQGRFVDQFLPQDMDALSVSSHMTGVPFGPGAQGTSQDSLPYMTSGTGMMDHHVNPQFFDSGMGLMVTSPHSWGSLSPVSRTPSPIDVKGLHDDVWSTSTAHTDISPTESLASNSPELAGQSPRISRKVDRSHFVTSEDLPGNAMNMVGDDAWAVSGAFNSRRLSGEGESARDHYLYKSALPQADGLFHCPWEGQPSCNHKPEKLKCNYDKFVDSHLKPYRCKVEGCQNARFSSTACLLRHEREAHAMHGHGEKPYLCTYDGCERSMPGHGFPRQWNLRDHMRRVHNDNGPTSAPVSSPPSNGASSSSGRGRKRKTDVPEKASSGEKASHRKSSKASTDSASKAGRSLSARDIEAWQHHHQALQALVQGFGQPLDSSFMQSCQEAQNHLAAMSTISAQLVATDPRALWKQSG